MTKTVYLFNEVSKEYAGVYEAHESPEEAGEFIIPVCSTDTAPPELTANQVAVQLAGEWSIQANYRGYAGYDSNGVLHEINDINIAPDPSWTLTPPTIPVDYTTASKLKLLDYFDSIGLYTDLMTIIKSDDKRYQRWLIAGNISIDDPMVAPVRTAMGWTSQQLQDLFNALNAN